MHHTHTEYVKVPDKKLGTDSLSTQDEFSLNLLPPPLLGDGNPLSTFLETSASTLKSFMTLATTGTEKSQYVIIWVKSHPAPPQPPDGRANPLLTFLWT